MTLTMDGAGTPYRGIFERLARDAEEHLQAIERICEEACELREQMIEELCPEVDTDRDPDGVIADLYNKIYGFDLMFEAMGAVGM